MLEPVRGRPVQEARTLRDKPLRCLSAGLNYDYADKEASGTHEVRVWWRRRELNPGPKTVSALRLHV